MEILLAIKAFLGQIGINPVPIRQPMLTMDSRSAQLKTSNINTL